jgi:hypothetical protein
MRLFRWSPAEPWTAAVFQGLAAVPAEAKWFADLGNNATRRAYQNALQAFMRFVGIAGHEKPNHPFSRQLQRALKPTVRT